MTLFGTKREKYEKEFLVFFWISKRQNESRKQIILKKENKKFNFCLLMRPPWKYFDVSQTSNSNRKKKLNRKIFFMTFEIYLLINKMGMCCLLYQNSDSDWKVFFLCCSWKSLFTFYVLSSLLSVWSLSNHIYFFFGLFCLIFFPTFFFCSFINFIYIFFDMIKNFSCTLEPFLWYLV